MTVQAPLSLAAIHTESSAGVSRVWADVDGQPLWFSSADAVLRPVPEAFAGALLMPALAQRRRLAVETPVCAQWQASLPAVLRLFHRWWQLPEISPELRVRSPLIDASPARIGLCFSGGVDSFFSLLRYQPQVDVLVYVYDYDIPIRGHTRPPHFESWLRRLSEQAGVQAVVIRTNLKRHPIFRNTNWLAAHGACLAAIGHLLNGLIGTLVLSSSYCRTDPHPSGTHWALDPLWSSSQLNCVHFGDTHTRSQKLRAIAQEPLVREFLRPCWQNLEDRQNCAECEKCLRTQLVLLQCGELANYPAFRHDVPLAQRITQLRRIATLEVTKVYEGLLPTGLPLSVEQAVSDLVCRTHRYLVRRQRKDALRRWAGRLCRLEFAPRFPASST